MSILSIYIYIYILHALSSIYFGIKWSPFKLTFFFVEKIKNLFNFGDKKKRYEQIESIANIILVKGPVSFICMLLLSYNIY